MSGIAVISMQRGYSRPKLIFLFNVAEKATLETQSGWVPLLLCLMHEATSQDSQWKPYLDLIPDYTELDLPMFWSK